MSGHKNEHGQLQLIIRITSVLGGLVGLAAAGSASAGPAPGEGTLLVDSGYAMPRQPSADSITRTATLGYQASTQFDLGVQQVVNYAGMADAETLWDHNEAWQGRTAGFANLDLLETGFGLVPFVGAFAGLDYDQENASAFMGPHAGFSQYLDETTFLRVRYRYEWSSEDDDGKDLAADAEQGEHVVSIGLGVTF